MTMTEVVLTLQPSGQIEGTRDQGRRLASQPRGPWSSTPGTPYGLPSLRHADSQSRSYGASKPLTVESGKPWLTDSPPFIGQGTGETSL